MAVPLPADSADAASADTQEAAQDAIAIERVLRGDAEAYAELVLRHTRRAFSIAYRIVLQREDAEDVVQDAFIQALQHLDSLQRGRPFRPWFYRIVVNRALNVRRASLVRRTEQVPERTASPLALPDRHAERALLRGRLAAALAELPDTQRTVVVLAELEDLTSAEIATILDMSAGTVRWHLHQARRTLRQTLEPLKEET
jgi:RNA polymerase sigma-70 factor (ECF subfamily)